MGESSPAAVHTVASPGLFRYSILLFDIVACSAGAPASPSQMGDERRPLAGLIGQPFGYM